MSLTKEQLDAAAIILENIEAVAKTMRHIVMTASDGIVDNITLTLEQTDELKAAYLAQKSEIVDLYNQLPG